MRLWQRLAARWSHLVFGADLVRVTRRIRCLRLLEEVLELSQAEEVTEDEAIVIVRQVYGRPVGEAQQELGGVMTTLCAYAATAGYDIEEAWWSEFERIIDPAMMEKVRSRNLSGDKIGMRPGEHQAGSGLTDGG